MINRSQLLNDLKTLVRALEADLRARFADEPEYRTRLETEWQDARNAGRTAEALEIWAEAQFTQAAVAWVLACVFIRFCEDNGLLDAPLIAGSDARGQSAQVRQEQYYARFPTHADNDYLRDVFAAAAQLPGLADVMRAQKVMLAAPVSVPMGKQLLRFFRAQNADDGHFVHDFADPEWNTRFLGDLYQDLSEAARERYALLQTPEFVESFILDRTLTPALDVYALEEVDVIDPTCGSGHFLLGAFERLAPLWLRKQPDNLNVALQAVLDRVAGVDLNPYAVVIARFRLLIAALRMAQVSKLRLAPDFKLHIETGDSLLHGFDQRDYNQAQHTLELSMHQENLGEAADHLYRHAFAAEDLAATNAILARKYAVVVGNPPYITVKDRAVSALYRERYESCSGKYALVSPFCERFWALAKSLDNVERAGYVGLIVANSFMKREFGKKLVEGFFSQTDLTHVIDTSGAYIPGHGTPTVILMGRNRAPATSVVRAVMGIKGEPATPSDPAQGVVWSAIIQQIDQRNSESEWISVSDVERKTFAKHPWSIGGGGASELKIQIEQCGTETLASLGADIGRTTHTGADEVFYMPKIFHWLEFMVPIVLGEDVRDYSLHPETYTIFPYIKASAKVWEQIPPALAGHFWMFRKVLRTRSDFGRTPEERGLAWFEHSMFFPARWHVRLGIAFAEVATHNHFVLDRGDKVFKQTSPVIKFNSALTEEILFGILGLLNSSSACFWLKQVCHNKGSTVDQHGARQRTAAFEDFYALNSTKIGQFPISENRPIELGMKMDRLAIQRASRLPAVVIGSSVPDRAGLDEERRSAESLRAQMIAWQEELDWQVYQYYDILDDALVYSGEPPEVQLGERAFEIVLAQDCAAGITTTTWFERHGSTPITEVPAHWPSDYRALVAQRIAAIRRSRDLALIERPECKRRWAGADWATLEKAALENWLLDRLEQHDLWPREALPAPKLQSVRELVDALSGDENFRRALDLYAGHGSDAHATMVALLEQACVPYLDAMRYSESGLRKRAVWHRTWAMQRAEDAIDAAVAEELKDQPEQIATEQARRKAAEVGDIPVPPKYKTEDFSATSYWKLRGALDVPKERFISFPNLQRSNDAMSPMLLWAGYDAKQRALALAGWLYDMLQREGSDLARIVPALAGLDEMLPWVHQWHPELDDDLGMSTGDYLQGLLDTQLAQHNLTLAAVRAWQPPAPARRTRRTRAA